MTGSQHPPLLRVPPPRLLVFDLDGTLVDSVHDLLACANRMLRRHGRPRMTAAELRPMIGDGLHALAERVLLGRGVRPGERAVSAFTADYAAHPADRSTLFPGIAAMLEDAEATGWRLAVCTNKPAALAEALLDALGLGGRFAAVGGGDSFASRKPDPAHLLGTIAMARGRRELSVMVGDHRNDVAAARGAGVPAILAGWGYGGPDMHGGAGVVIADPSAVPQAAGRLLEASPAPQ